MKPVRLDKFLANLGIGTRKELKTLLKKGEVTLNGQVVTAPDTKIDPEQDQITYKGSPLTYQKYYYYMLNKPAGCVSATRDPDCQTVLDLLKPEHRNPELFPVGRLDKDTEGLLLLTNDGALAHSLLSPRKHISKTYYVIVDGDLTQDHVHAFAEGIDIGEKKPCQPATLTLLDSNTDSDPLPDGQAAALVCIQEGKFHQIKRMFQKTGRQVLFLKRLSMGHLSLDPHLAPGQYRPLTDEEVTALHAGKAACHSDET